MSTLVLSLSLSFFLSLSDSKFCFCRGRGVFLYFIFLSLSIVTDENGPRVCGWSSKPAHPSDRHESTGRLSPAEWIDCALGKDRCALLFWYDSLKLD